MCFSHVSYSQVYSSFTYSPTVGEGVLIFPGCWLFLNIWIHSYRLVLARAAVKNRDAILGMWLVTSCYQDLTGYYMAVLHHDDVISNSCLVCVDAGTVIVECECHYCLWQNHWALEGSGCSTLSEMPLFFQDGDMLVALGRKASSALLLFLQEHFAPLFVICRVEN